jgi:hypothetical protein
MGSLFMIFVYAFFFYLIFKAIRFFIQYMSEPESVKKKADSSAQSQQKLQIKKEDIIDAEFEELRPEKKENQKAR